MERGNLYPFVAVVGQEKAKRALLAALVNPAAGGVLVSGRKGTAKTTLVRAAAELAAPQRLVDVPLNVTEDRLYGTLNLEAAVQEGQRRFEAGLLVEADENLLYVDEANLLRQELLTTILDVRQQGRNVVERDGFSSAHRARFVLLATMNPEEGTLPPTLLDRFGLFVDVDSLQERGNRVEIMRRRLSFERDKTAFRERFRGEMETLRDQVRQARTRLPSVEVSDAMIALAAEWCSRSFCAGHRADLYLLETARAFAALDGRDYVLPDDMGEASVYVLPHRMRQIPPQEQEDGAEPPDDWPDDRTDETQDDAPDTAQDNPQDGDGDDGPEDNGQNKPDGDGADGETGDGRGTPEPGDTLDGAENGESRGEAPAPDEQVASIAKGFFVPPLVWDDQGDRIVRRGSGKRSRTRTDLKQGRYVRAAQYDGKTSDIALDATLRAAAPYQAMRPKQGCAVTVTRDDLRRKVREKRVGMTLLFDVDASGSMGARERMGAVKGAIFQLLEDAYQKRDHVGMIAFRRDAAEVLLPLTRSIDLAKKCLETLPTGGRTPLPEGLEKALVVLDGALRKDPGANLLLILVTDGRTNRAAAGDPVAESLSLAGKIAKTGVPSLVIDTEQDFIKLGVARDVAAAMGAQYYTLQGLTKEKLLRIVRRAGRPAGR